MLLAMAMNISFHLARLTLKTGRLLTFYRWWYYRVIVGVQSQCWSFLVPWIPQNNQNTISIICSHLIRTWLRLFSSSLDQTPVIYQLSVTCPEHWCNDPNLDQTTWSYHYDPGRSALATRTYQNGQAPAYLYDCILPWYTPKYLLHSRGSAHLYTFQEFTRKKKIAIMVSSCGTVFLHLKPQKSKIQSVQHTFLFILYQPSVGFIVTVFNVLSLPFNCLTFLII